LFNGFTLKCGKKTQTTSSPRLSFHMRCSSPMRALQSNRIHDAIECNCCNGRMASGKLAMSGTMRLMVLSGTDWTCSQISQVTTCSLFHFQLFSSLNRFILNSYFSYAIFILVLFVQCVSPFIFHLI